MFSNLSPLEMLVYGIGAILLLFIALRLAKFFFRIVIIVAIIAAIYYFLTNKNEKTNTPDNNNTVSTESIFGDTAISVMHKKCNNGTSKDTKCVCLVNPVYTDLRTRYTELGLKELEDNKVLMLNEIRKSLKKTYPEIESCLKQRGSEGLKFLDMLQLP
ncbi:MAG: hypothetical protein IPM47_09075 [Sphingobacteriales bacterium]|nr:MAG: hypothetical protein IPM47_09075 [Sphingobacteriales bacterium]